jgi:hypothetical protein
MIARCTSLPRTYISFEKAKIASADLSTGHNCEEDHIRPFLSVLIWRVGTGLTG